MVDRRGRPKQSSSGTASAAMLVVATFFALPAAAVTTGQVPCAEPTQATLQVSVATLVAKATNHETLVTIDDLPLSRAEETPDSASFLAPRAEAAIREIFGEAERLSPEVSNTQLINAVLTPPMAGIDSKTESVNGTESSPEPEPATDMKTRLPGISEDLSLYKRRMFRRDI